MNFASKPPQSVIARLPRYFRALRELLSSEIYRVSSGELSMRLGFSASQVRSDLSRFGEFGQQGYGYNVRLLYTGVSEALGVTDDFSAVVIGNNTAARAVASDALFARHGIILRGVFSDIPSDGAQDIDTLGELLSQQKTDIAVLCSLCSKTEQQLYDILAGGGIRAVWNVGSLPLRRELWRGIILRDCALCDPLMGLCCSLKYDESDGGDAQ